MGLDALCQTLGAVDARIVGGLPTVRGPTCADALEALLARMREAHALSVSNAW
jgi:hypothetical protein